MSDNPAAYPVVRREQLLIALLTIWLVITGVVFGLRVASVVRARDLISATGMEAMPTYGVWKARNGFPVFEDPFRWAYPGDLYNLGFYKTYGWIVSLTGANGADVVLPARAVTFVFSLIGVVGLVMAAREVCGSAKRQAAAGVFFFVAVVLGVQAFYSSNFTSWWSLGIRPDVGAAAMLAWAWFFLLRGLNRRALGYFFAGGVLFYSNWCFKQTSVLTLSAAVLYLLIVERWWRAAVVLTLTSGALIGTTLLLWMLVPHYLDNVFIAPQGNVFSLKVGINQVVAALGQNPLVFGLPLVFVVFRKRGFITAAQRLPFFAAIIMIPPTLIAVARIGGGRNYMFEEYLACTLCTAALISRALEIEEGALNKRVMRLATGLVALSCLFPVAQMILKDRIGRVWVPADEIRRYRELSSFIESKPDQILVLEDMFAQPWHATANKHPATVIDVVVYESAQRRGLIKDGGIERVIREKRYPHIIVRIDPLQPYNFAIKNGYHDEPLPAANQAGLRYLTRD